MNKQIISDMIPLAMDACEIWLINDGKQRDAIYGKVASFGVDIMQRDLLPAVMSFEDSRPKSQKPDKSDEKQQDGKGNQQKDGWRVNSAVYYIVANYLKDKSLLEKYSGMKDAANRDTFIWSTDDIRESSKALLKEALLTLYNNERTELIPVTKMLVLHACVALKMTLNTFEGGKSS